MSGLPPTDRTPIVSIYFSITMVSLFTLSLSNSSKYPILPSTSFHHGEFFCLSLYFFWVFPTLLIIPNLILYIFFYHHHSESLFFWVFPTLLCISNPILSENFQFVTTAATIMGVVILRIHHQVFYSSSKSSLQFKCLLNEWNIFSFCRHRVLWN